MKTIKKIFYLLLLFACLVIQAAGFYATGHDAAEGASDNELVKVWGPAVTFLLLAMIFARRLIEGKWWFSFRRKTPLQQAMDNIAHRGRKSTWR